MPSPILIAGAGIGGLAAALALQRQGFRVRLFERTATVGDVGAGSSARPTRCGPSPSGWSRWSGRRRRRRFLVAIQVEALNRHRQRGPQHRRRLRRLPRHLVQLTVARSRRGAVDVLTRSV